MRAVWAAAAAAALLLGLLAAAAPAPPAYPAPQREVNMLRATWWKRGHPAPQPAGPLLLRRLVAWLAHQDRFPPRTRFRAWPEDRGGWLSEFDPALSPRGERLVSKRQDGPRVLRYPRLAPKWKTKKGKTLNTPIACFFKLCAFRTPV